MRAAKDSCIFATYGKLVVGDGGWAVRILRQMPGQFWKDRSHTQSPDHVRQPKSIVQYGSNIQMANAAERQA